MPTTAQSGHIFLVFRPPLSWQTSLCCDTFHPSLSSSPWVFLPQAALHSWTGQSSRLLTYLYLLAFEWLLSCVSCCQRSKPIVWEKNTLRKKGCVFIPHPHISLNPSSQSELIFPSHIKLFLSISNGLFTHLLWVGCVHLPSLATALPVYSTNFDGQYLTQCSVVWQ